MRFLFSVRFLSVRDSSDILSVWYFLSVWDFYTSVVANLEWFGQCGMGDALIWRILQAAWTLFFILILRSIFQTTSILPREYWKEEEFSGCKIWPKCQYSDHHKSRKASQAVNYFLQSDPDWPESPPPGSSLFLERKDNNFSPFWDIIQDQQRWRYITVTIGS